MGLGYILVIVQRRPLQPSSSNAQLLFYGYRNMLRPGRTTDSLQCAFRHCIVHVPFRHDESNPPIILQYSLPQYLRGLFYYCVPGINILNHQYIFLFLNTLYRIIFLPSMFPVYYDQVKQLPSLGLRSLRCVVLPKKRVCISTRYT